MMTHNSTLELIKEKYPYLSDEFGVEKIGIFGSVAKETEREVSDIDIVSKLSDFIFYIIVAAGFSLRFLSSDGCL